MLTTEQKATLKAYVEADPVLSQFPHTFDGAYDMTVALDAPISPTFYVWKSSVPTDEIMLNGFDWTRVDNLTVGKARIWEWMTNLGILKPNQANVRAGVLAVFTTAGDLANRVAVFSHFQRPATIAEKIFATGAGTSSTDQGSGPATMTIEGRLNYTEVYQAMGW